MKKTIPVTKAGYEELQEKWNTLKEEKLVEANKQVKAGRAFCDFHEDPEFDRSLDELNKIQEQISELESILARAEIIGEANSDVVQHGALVTFKEYPDGEEETFQVVSAAEVDAKKLQISDNSPIGRALLGRKVNEEVSVETPAGTVKLLITKVQYKV
ncbi:hypothetical protein CAI16_05740 [Virgibacillus dokdonensis]|uniref:Transcription elongation factor GreA n=1 Tax=Virgibacillus dokdonensis TaxID=302167 RepID=A0A3E0WTX1_9BACI|nr:GreA/GreB family elongation factor [Virgibacillus dokdonensis]RFA36288.1 hypothetical protein CAI16_05740 [Virgibacillus dokdonensis]